MKLHCFCVKKLRNEKYLLHFISNHLNNAFQIHVCLAIAIVIAYSYTGIN